MSKGIAPSFAEKAICYALEIFWDITDPNPEPKTLQTWGAKVKIIPSMLKTLNSLWIRNKRKTNNLKLKQHLCIELCSSLNE